MKQLVVLVCLDSFSAGCNDVRSLPSHTRTLFHDWCCHFLHRWNVLDCIMKCDYGHPQKTYLFSVTFAYLLLCTIWVEILSFQPRPRLSSLSPIYKAWNNHFFFPPPPICLIQSPFDLMKQLDCGQGEVKVHKACPSHLT